MNISKKLVLMLLFFIYASGNLLNDRDVAVAAVSKNRDYYYDIEESLKNDPSILSMVENSPLPFFLFARMDQPISSVHKASVMQMIQKDPNNFIFLTPSMKNDEKAISQAGTQNDFSLAYASKILRNKGAMIFPGARENRWVLPMKYPKKISKEI